MWTTLRHVRKWITKTRRNTSWANTRMRKHGATWAASARPHIRKCKGTFQSSFLFPLPQTSHQLPMASADSSTTFCLTQVLLIESTCDSSGSSSASPLSWVNLRFVFRCLWFVVPTSGTLFLFYFIVAPFVDHAIDHTIYLFIFTIIPFYYIVPYLTGKFPSWSFWTSCQVRFDLY